MTRAGEQPAWLMLTGPQIRHARERLGLTQEQFGLYLGRRMRRGHYPSIRTITRWETGATRLGPLYGTVLLQIVREVEAHDGLTHTP